MHLTTEPETPELAAARDRLSDMVLRDLDRWREHARIDRDAHEAAGRYAAGAYARSNMAELDAHAEREIANRRRLRGDHEGADQAERRADEHAAAAREWAKDARQERNRERNQ